VKIAIISGGSRGIGAEISKTFMEAGYLVIIGSRSEPKFELSNGSSWVMIDATTQTGHEKLFAEAKNKAGFIETYINNVGYSEWRSIEDVDEAFITKMFSSNIISTIYGCKVAAHNLTAGSSIINISSIAGKRGTKNNSIYCATKFGVNGITQALAKELGKKGIRVNAICPVLIETDGLLEALGKKYSPVTDGVENFIKTFISEQVALTSLPTSQDVAELSLFLSGPTSSSITGQCINIDAGVIPS
jgi:3-oxoacyl-[acyl-carrier protein] reductase/meso-butanediol dehydrogenase/(S,S)-butanediol dehydrogenase/diacetyl reductase